MEWREITEVDGAYSVSEYGQVRNNRTGRVLKYKVDKDGYHSYKMSVGGKLIYGRSHRLVAEYFLPNPDNLPVVNHKDHTKTNNHYTNLEWCTVAHNTRHYYTNACSDSKGRPLSSLTKEETHSILTMRKDNKSYREICESFRLNCSPDTLNALLSGRRLSEVSGFISDQRTGFTASKKITDMQVNDIISGILLHNRPRKYYVEKYKTTDSRISRILSGKQRKDCMKTYLVCGEIC